LIQLIAAIFTASAKAH